MKPPIVINLESDKPKYISSIREAHNGRFAVEVEVEIIRRGPMSPEEAQKKIGGFMQRMQDMQEEAPTDAKLREIYANAGVNPSTLKEEEEEVSFVGLHVFTTFKEMTKFLSSVYEKNEKA